MLSEGFKLAFPDQVYKSDIALQRFLQIPFAAIRVGAPQSGRAAWFLVEYVEGVDYVNFACFSEAIFRHKKSSDPIGMDRRRIRALLGLASSDKERELIRYSIFKTSGLTQTAARRQFGFEGMQDRTERVEQCIEAAQSIREAIEKLSLLQDKALVTAMGLEGSDSSSSESETESDPRLEEATSFDDGKLLLLSFSTLQEVLQQGQYNWFTVVDFIEQEIKEKISDSVLEGHLKEFYSYASEFPLDSKQKELLATSHVAFLASLPDQNEFRTASLLNGEIVTDSESDDAEEYIGLTSVTCEKSKAIIARKRKSLARRIQRLKAKTLAERNFLSRQITRKVKTVVDRFPDIGQCIESFVSEANVGADAWRRTGVLTFDGNLRVKEKVTYERIRQHLQEKYQVKFSYGTVVQLCIARNRRRRSSKNYKGVAKVTTRRARKGFELRYNPDKHWSAALYRGLNVIQYTDGRDITNINRDDASGFRLDTLSTHCKHTTPVIGQKQILTTHTDYVNRYPSTLQTTSYNFTGTRSTQELCAGVVKGAKVYPKNQTQHYADLEMLYTTPELLPAFTNPLSGDPKRIECIRVDGATDEGPSHDEVKFWWAARHLKHGKLVTLVSSRSSGSSYLNRVELQNGCLALAHTNLFIPSTLSGSVFSPDTGAIDIDRVRKNLDLATSVYIDRVNNCPCGETVIHLYKGACSDNLQKEREHLLMFLKGSRKKKEELRKKEPQLYTYFTTVWDVRQRHEIPGLPPQYVYLLVCCFQHDCPHSLCQAGKNGIPLEWFPGGPQVNQIPLPIPDPDQPWGSKSCDKCSGFCCGHFLHPEAALKSQLTPIAQPPSTILKDFHLSLSGKDPSEVVLEEIAKKTLLSVCEVRMWLDHLKTVDSNRKRGAAKAAATRQRKRESQRATVAYHCGVCGALFGDSEDQEFWIGCEKCDSWFHGDCVGITPENEPDKFYCSSCA